jgi:uncharacterized protein YaiL (DUF2058 family)
MGNSLQDQLLKAGLVDEKKVKQAAKGKGKHNQKKKQKRNSGGQAAPVVDPAQAARDRELNLQRRQEQERREREAQIRQLIESHQLKEWEGELAYNFVLEGKVKRIHVNEETHRKLTKGLLAIALNGLRMAPIPREPAEKIAERDASRVVLIDSAREEKPKDEEDPYAGYEVPDDLMW